MSEPAPSPRDGLPVLILAPLGGDGAAIAAVVRSVGAAAEVCRDARSLEARLASGGWRQTQMIIVAQEGADEQTGRTLTELLEAEASWSRLPVVFLVEDAKRLPPACRMLETAASPAPYLVLQRPVQKPVLHRAVEVQLAARRRQFETADLLDRLAEAETRQRFLLGELRHRTHNMLAVLQAFFRMSARRAVGLESLAESFSQRLNAMSEAYSALAGDGPGEEDLRDVVEGHAVPYCRRPEQLRLSGPAFTMPARLSFELALIFHELATNAAKHGALSREDGVVHVSWEPSADGQEVEIEWREEEGPPVYPPKRRGLGSDLIGGASLGARARVELDFRPEGVLWRAHLGLAETQATDAQDS